jgi:hypothetical protein
MEIEVTDYTKERHWFVTGWLILKIAANCVTAYFYLKSIFILKSSPIEISGREWIIILLTAIAIINVLLSILLLNWRKMGFWGFVLTGILIFIINLNIGTNLILSLLGLCGIPILFGILRIKRNGVSAWDGLG